MKTLYIWLIISLIVLYSQAKFQKGSVVQEEYRKTNFKYLSRFSYKVGQGIFKFRARFKVPEPQLAVDFTHIGYYLAVVSDDHWNNFQASKNCDELKQHAAQFIELGLPIGSEWSDENQHFVEQYSRTRVWYYALCDCYVRPKDGLTLNNLVTKENRIFWELTMYNTDGTQFSEEQNGIMFLHFLELVVLAVFFLLNSARIVRFYRTQESWDLPYLVLNLSILLEAVSVFMEWLHLWQYSKDGVGTFLFDEGSVIVSLLAQFLISMLLIILATGWYVTYEKIEDWNIYFPIALVLAVAHIGLVALYRLNEDAAHTWHDYEHLCGFLIMGIRVVLFVAFFFLSRSTISKLAGENEKIDFFNNLRFLGTVYLLALPVLVFISTFIAPYVRNKVIVIGTLTLQIGVSMALSYFLGSKRSKYNQVSLKGRTLLPSNKLE